MPHDPQPEFSRPLRLARVSAEGREETLTATPAECAALAHRFGIPAINRLEARLRLRQTHGGVVAAEGRLRAEVVQDCVVTLDPVVQQVDAPFSLRFLPPGSDPSDDPEGPDEIALEGEEMELGEAVAEQLSLALDPYPRSPDALLPEDGEGQAETQSGPFAALAALKRQG